MACTPVQSQFLRSPSALGSSLPTSPVSPSCGILTTPCMSPGHHQHWAGTAGFIEGLEVTEGEHPIAQNKTNLWSDSHHLLSLELRPKDLIWFPSLLTSHPTPNSQPAPGNSLLRSTAEVFTCLSPLKSGSRANTGIP